MRKKGFSYNAINRRLGIPKSTISNWFSKTDWSKKIENTLSEKQKMASSANAKKMVLQNKINFRKKISSFRNSAKKEYEILKNDPLLKAGLMLYLGEGDNKFDNSLVRLSNINPKIISIFTVFLKHVCRINIEKIRSTMILYKDLDEKDCKKYWNQFLGLPIENFYKTQYIIGRHKKRKLSYGICNISVSDRELKEKIFVWTEMICEELINKRV